ncbi:hypothetical protein Tco_0172260, partial [Tanacetum coccineum]
MLLDTLFRCDPIWGCYRLVSRAKVKENQVKYFYLDYNRFQTLHHTKGFSWDYNRFGGVALVDTVTSLDEASSGVTYTSISSDYEEPSDVGSPGVVIYRYDRLPMHLVDPPSPDYMPSPEEPKQAPLSPDYVSGPEYPEYLALSDEEVPVKDHPYAAADSPIALSLGYIADSDPEDESEDGPTDTEEMMMMMMMTRRGMMLTTRTRRRPLRRMRMR